MSLTDLLNLDVTSVSRKPTRFADAAAAIAVISGDDIRRSGATTIPDALRLVTGLDVARSNGRTWALSARGFNTTAANKMQVLLDGRTLYTPLYSGVFWDVQDTLMEDIDRIEIIRGPGATMWGADAVNGVINIITKSAKETQGGLIAAATGTTESGHGGVRYGNKVGRTYFRTYMKYLDQDGLVFPSGAPSNDGRQMGQGGFRTDSEIGDKDTVTVQGDLYSGRFGQDNNPDIAVDGLNLLTRWNRRLSEKSDFQLQFYYDGTKRDIPRQFGERRNTYDVDIQHRLGLPGRHDVIWGFDYHGSSDHITNSPTLAFLPDHHLGTLFSGFAQDEITLVEGELGLTVGSKVEHNEFSGFDYQPSARLAWTPTTSETVWGAVSRAVRTPTRLDTGLQGMTPTGLVLFRGDPGFLAETALAYELGYRVQPHKRVSFDLATFYNVYDHLRSQEPEGPNGLPVVLRNELQGHTYGAESAVNVQVTKWWRLRPGHTYLRTNLKLRPESLDPSGGAGEGNSPQNQFLLNSSMNLPGRLELDSTLRYVGALPNPSVPRYAVMDARVGWSPIASLELAIVGQNLFDPHHPEFGAQTATSKQVQQGIYAKVTWRVR